MVTSVSFSEDPAWVLAEATAFLATEPAVHNLILTLLHARAAHAEPGRYWVAREDDAFSGSNSAVATVVSECAVSLAAGGMVEF